jgi:hypothetical protein
LSKLSGYKAKIVANCLEKKLDIDFGSGTEMTGWYYVGEKKILRVTVPKEHGGSSLSPKVAKKVIGSLRLTNDEFRNLYNCPMSGSDYEQKVESLISQGLL